MKKVLVICDNIFQQDRIKDLIRIKNRPWVDFTFCQSAVKRNRCLPSDYLNSVNEPINVKSETPFILSNFDLLISAHCLQIFPEKLVNNMRCINIHPGYNPINRGWYPQVFSLVYDLPIGATIHEIDDELDHGKIIARKFVEKNVWDTSFSLYQKILTAEIELLDEYFDQIIDGTYSLTEPENEGNIYSKKDFNELCSIDLSEKGTLNDFYNRLRALSHGDYKNAYFIDRVSGKKIFIKIEISYE
jgi:methionyl-tRNA formyltransferase